MRYFLLSSMRLLIVSIMLLVVSGSSVFACSYSNTPITGFFPDIQGARIPTPYGCKKPQWCCPYSYFQNMAKQYFNNYRKDFIMGSFYSCPVNTTFQQTADELRNATLMRIAAWGAFIDASIFNDTVREIGVSTAQTLQSYAPSEQICKIGTLSRSLSGSESKMNDDRMILSQVGLNKNLGTKNTISAAGLGLEVELRLVAFSEKFCSLKDNKEGMSQLCDAANPVKDLQHNRDVDFTRLMDNNVTINADLTDTNLTQDETSVVAMSHFLYGHRQPTQRISSSDLSESEGKEDLYAEYRAVAAQRAAAQNSYNTLAAMKMAGSGSSESYMRQILSYLGLPAGDVTSYLGGQNSDYPAVNSSYNAQMNMITKQIYQDPAFYANLMDSKTNVKRTSAALQAIGLMQGRDTYKSMERSEMLAAILLNLEARKKANNVNGVK